MDRGTCAVSEPATTVVFDFDLTLTNWDTADHFFRWLLRRQPWRWAMVLALVPVLLPLFLIRSTRRWPIWYAVWVATLGRSHEALRVLVTAHVDEVFAGAAAVFRQEGLACLQSHIQQGHRVVIATGCLEVLARELLARAGYAHVALVGSSLKPQFWGLASHEHCFGPRKIPMLSSRGFAPPWTVSYTDHQCDLPILKLSDQRFLVNPKPEAVQLIERELACKASILAWR